MKAVNGQAPTQAAGNKYDVIVLGSAALNSHFPAEVRLPGDYDIAGTYENCMEWIHYVPGEITSVTYPKPNKMLVVKDNVTYIECELAWWDDSTTTDDLIRLCTYAVNSRHGDYSAHRTGDLLGIVPSLNFLYMLKMSHRYLKNSPHFLKTMEDIHFMRSKGAKIEDQHREFYERRKKETYGYKHPKLNQTKKDFFTDDVPYVYDHDDIHEAVKHMSLPAYKYYQPAESEVDCSKDMFYSAMNETRLFGVLEETYVLALERSQIPSRYEEDPKVSFDIALMKVCTSITSGWFRHFAWENYYEIQKMYDPEYVTRFTRAVKEGRVKRHGK